MPLAILLHLRLSFMSPVNELRKCISLFNVSKREGRHKWNNCMQIGFFMPIPELLFSLFLLFIFVTLERKLA